MNQADLNSTARKCLRIMSEEFRGLLVGEEEVVMSDSASGGKLVLTNKRLFLCGTKGLFNVNSPFKVKAVKIGNSIRVTIPKEVADCLKIKPGDFLQVTVDNSHIIIKKGSQ